MKCESSPMLFQSDYGHFDKYTKAKSTVQHHYFLVPLFLHELVRTSRVVCKIVIFKKSCGKGCFSTYKYGADQPYLWKSFSQLMPHDFTFQSYHDSPFHLTFFQSRHIFAILICSFRSESLFIFLVPPQNDLILV